MKLEDCKKGLKVKVLGKTIHGTAVGCLAGYPALNRGWGYVQSIGTPNHTDTVYLTVKPDGPTESGGYSPNDLEPYEPEETEYRQLKDITPRAIFEAQHGLGITNRFMREFTRFIMNFSLLYYETVSFTDLVWELENELEWTTWLIQHGFIEKVVKPEEITYTYGNKLVNDGGEKAEIVQTGATLVCIIHNSNRWVDPITVKDVTCITVDEFRQMNGLGGTWRKDK